jgi:hypothetical protein
MALHLSAVRSGYFWGRDGTGIIEWDLWRGLVVGYRPITLQTTELHLRAARLLKLLNNEGERGAAHCQERAEGHPILWCHNIYKYYLEINCTTCSYQVQTPILASGLHAP